MYLSRQINSPMCSDNVHQRIIDLIDNLRDTILTSSTTLSKCQTSDLEDKNPLENVLAQMVSENKTVGTILFNSMGNILERFDEYSLSHEEELSFSDIMSCLNQTSEDIQEYTQNISSIAQFVHSVGIASKVDINEDSSVHEIKDILENILSQAHVLLLNVAMESRQIEEHNGSLNKISSEINSFVVTTNESVHDLKRLVAHS